MARCIEASADGVRVVVLPRVVDVRHMLDSVYGVLAGGTPTIAPEVGGDAKSRYSPLLPASMSARTPGR